MSQPPAFDALKRNANLPPAPSDTARMRVADLVAHTRAAVTDEACPVPACHHCALEFDNAQEA